MVGHSFNQSVGLPDGRLVSWIGPSIISLRWMNVGWLVGVEKVGKKKLEKNTTSNYFIASVVSADD